MIEEKLIDIDISHPNISNTYSCLWICGYNQSTHNQVTNLYEFPPSNEKWMHLYNPYNTSSVIDTDTQRHTFLRWNEENDSTITNRKFKSIWNTVALYRWKQYVATENYQWNRYSSVLTYQWNTYPAQLWYQWDEYKYTITRSVWDVWTPGWGVGMMGNPDYAGQVTVYGPGPPTGNYAKTQLVSKYGSWSKLQRIESTDPYSVSGVSQLPSYPNHDQIAYLSEGSIYKKSSTTSNGTVTSTSRSAYVDNGYNSSISKWTEYSTSYYVQGGYVTQVVTGSRYSYTDNARNSDGYWYIYYGMYYTCGSTTGNTVKSIDTNAYPSNGRNSYDGYWYIKQ